jgi:subtilisin family serine protease
MKNFRNFLLLITVITLSSVGWNNFHYENTSDQITDYYYYQGQKYYLVHKPDMIYIKLKQAIPRSEFISLFGSYGDIPNDYSYEKNEDRQFIKLRTVSGNASLNTYINQIRTFPQVEYASPVFGMREGMGNANTLMGCENNIVAQFKPQYNKQQVEAYLNSKGMYILQELELTGGLTFLISIPVVPNKSSLDFANEVYVSGMVNYSDPGLFFTNLLQYIPNDPFFNMQWAAINTGSNIPGGISGTPDCDMGLDTAWDQTLGHASVRISIVDTGIDTTHPDLVARIINGFQWNYYSGTYGGIDDYGHGAMCAGIAAATGNNSIGISGVAPLSRMFSAKIFNSAGSTTTTAIINGLNGVRTFGNCWVSSNSWGGGSPISAADNAILDGVNLGRGGKGIVWCFASGNGNTGTLSWPSSNPNVISVGGNSPCNQRKSTTSCDLETFWGANYGSGLDVVAPCVKIYATSPGGGYTSTFNGTSSATPNVAGVAALLLAKDSTQTWDTVRQRINRTALKKGSYSYTSMGPLTNLGNTWNNEMGYGIVNANLALLAVSPPPPPLANDVAVGPFLSLPGSFTAGTNYTIKARVQNLGTNNQTNVPIRFSVNGVIQTTNTIPNLPSGAIDSSAFSWTPSAAGNYTLRIFSGLAVDQNRNNDTVTTTVNVLPAGTTIVQQTLCRNGLNIPIPAVGTAVDSIVVNIPNSYNVTDLNMRIDTVLHTWDADLVFNILKGSTNVNFITNVGGSGDNFIMTKLDDSASIPISSGSPPFTGTFRPSNPLTPFNGIPVNGTWRLTITDGVAGDSGWLRAWCIQVCYQTVTGGIQQVELPNYYSLSQNYPNPFNPVTSIKYTIPKAGLVTLKVYDITGREVATLVNEVKEVGVYNIEFDATNLASGVYFYRLESGDFRAIKKMMLVK